MIEFADFEKVDLRVGTILEASENKGAKKPAYKLKIDFGELGIKWSSAQITDLYKTEELVGKQVIAVVNFKPIKISEVKSEVLVLGLDSESGVSLLSTDYKIENGKRVY